MTDFHDLKPVPVCLCVRVFVCARSNCFPWPPARTLLCGLPCSACLDNSGAHVGWNMAAVLVGWGECSYGMCALTQTARWFIHIFKWLIGESPGRHLLERQPQRWERRRRRTESIIRAFTAALSHRSSYLHHPSRHEGNWNKWFTSWALLCTRWMRVTTRWLLWNILHFQMSCQVLFMLQNVTQVICLKAMKENICKHNITFCLCVCVCVWGDMCYCFISCLSMKCVWRTDEQIQNILPCYDSFLT